MTDSIETKSDEYHRRRRLWILVWALGTLLVFGAVFVTGFFSVMDIQHVGTWRNDLACGGSLFTILIHFVLLIFSRRLLDRHLENKATALVLVPIGMMIISVVPYLLE